MRIVGYHIWNNIIASSDGDYTDKPLYIDFLLQIQDKDVIRIMYYLAQNMSALCKAININEQELRSIHESSNSKITIPPYKIRYVKDRFLNLQKGFYRVAPYAYFYDAHQYKDVQAEDDKTIEDCINKAKIAQQIGQNVYDAFNRLDIHVDKLISPVRAFEDARLSTMDLPSDEDCPKEASYYAYQGCVGNWLEALQIGHWDKVWNYDITSAYPAIAAQQMDIRKGKWIHSKNYIPEARYAECLCDVNIKSNISPVIYRAGERNNLPLNYTPTGERETCLNKRLIDYLIFKGQDEFEIKDGYWWIPNKDCNKPLEEIINWLYSKKEEQNGTQREVIKRIMAGIYGKFLEAREGSFGKYFMPIWAEDIETATRVEIMRFIDNNKLDPIHIAVDGVISSNPAILGEKRLGGWELSDISPCICTGTGSVAINSNANGNDFSLSYYKVRKLIEDNPSKEEYKLTKMSPVTIAEGLNGKFDKLGTLQEIHKYIGIGQDEKRCYIERPKNGGELLSRTYKSEPWDISMVQNLKEL